MTQMDVAKKMGVNRVAVTQWESGETFPSTSKILPLCELFNTNPDYLFTGVESTGNIKQLGIVFDLLRDLEEREGMMSVATIHKLVEFILREDGEVEIQTLVNLKSLLQ